MAQYSLSNLAEQDIEGIFEYTLRNFGEHQASAYIGQIKQSLQTAAVFPYIGREYVTKRGQSYRRFDCGRHALFYRPADNGIFLVRALHVMMDHDQLL